jgi:hypothetical protein
MKLKEAAVNKTRCLGSLAGVLTLACVSSSAHADTAPLPQAVARSAALLMVGRGNETTLGRPTIDDPADPNTNRRAGPGFEQATVSYLVGADKLPYVVVLVMESVQIPDYGPYQVSCTSYRLNPTSAPTATVTRKMMTKNKGARSANHPKAATAQVGGNNVIVWGYGSQMGGNRTATYMSVTNERCESLVPDQLVSPTAELNSQDNGAMDVAWNGSSDGGQTSMISAAYLSTGGDNDATYFMGFRLKEVNGLVTLEQLYAPKMIIAPSNIGRPALIADGLDRAVLCASKDGNGSRRPAGGGVDCARIAVAAGDTIWKNTVVLPVMSADPYKREYMAQPSLTRMDDGSYALQVLGSNGASKNGNTRNIKGSNLAHLYRLELNRGTEAIEVKESITGAAPYQTHAAICSGAFGVDSQRVVGVMGASPIGVGRAAMLMVHFDKTSTTPFTFDSKHDWWPVNWDGDSGWLANRDGENPGRQGRDFLRCIGDVPNPGHGVDKGYMADVKSFFVTAIPGRIPGDPKNSLFLSLLPAEVDTEGTPTNPVSAEDVPTGGGTPSNTGGAKDSNGCACATIGAAPTTSPIGGLSGIAIAGLFLAGIGARRKKA